jgi:hypothetical protein
VRSPVYLPFGLALLGAWLLYRYTWSKRLAVLGGLVLAATVASWQELSPWRPIQQTVEALSRDVERSVDLALDGGSESAGGDPVDAPPAIPIPLVQAPLEQLLMGGTGHRPGELDPLPYGKEPPSTCDDTKTGALFYDTAQRAVLLCDGKAWAGIAQVPTCSNPYEDLTKSTYTHFGSGNCGPYYHDQTWMSRDDRYVAGNYGWHDGCGRVDREPYCAIEYPNPVKVTRIRVLLHESPPSHCFFQGSQDSADGTNGTWVRLYGPVDFPTNHEGQWSQDLRFENPLGYRLYRLYCPGSPSFALYEWEMFCGG